MTYASPSGQAITYTGEVKFWSVEKGFGFIVPSDPYCNNGEDVFVHISETGGEGLVKGQRVAFELKFDNKKGKFQASGVRPGTPASGR